MKKGSSERGSDAATRYRLGRMRKWLTIILAMGAVIILSHLFIDSVFYAQIVSVAGVCLILWLTEATPPFVPSLVLWALIPLVLSQYDPTLTPAKVMTWAADPVLALFFCGFSLGLAAERHGLDRKMIGAALRFSGDSYNTLLFLIILVTAFLSMWMSNIAATALMIACLRPALERFQSEDILRRMLLVGVVLGADLGGMATPIGTGPNAVAIASMAERQPISFIGWMTFALPLTIGMLALGYLMLSWRVRAAADRWQIGDVQKAMATIEPMPESSTVSRRIFLVIIGLTVLLWLAEPIHSISATVVAMCGSAALFLTGVLGRASLKKIDWSTLMLIAGGITLGKLFESSGIIAELSASVPLDSFDPSLRLLIVCFFTASMAAVMSNTASVILLIPLATILIPEPSTPVLVALAASFGIPLIISTPPNAMAFGEGGVKSGDIFWPGIVIMILGCTLVSLTGPTVLRLTGIGG